jgi:hypothetical protein
LECDELNKIVDRVYNGSRSVKELRLEFLNFAKKSGFDHIYFNKGKITVADLKVLLKIKDAYF